MKLLIEKLKEVKTELEKNCPHYQITLKYDWFPDGYSITECKECPINGVIKYFEFVSQDSYDGYVNGSDVSYCAVKLLESIIDKLYDFSKQTNNESQEKHRKWI